MRFNTQQDFNRMLEFNKEVVNTIVDVSVLLYKISVEDTPINVYGEAPVKELFTAVQVPCLIRRDPATTYEDAGSINVRQPITFAFLREALKNKNVYPEIGDIVGWDNQFFEIDTVNEIQQYATRMEYNLSIVCDAHITRRRPTQIEPPNV